MIEWNFSDSVASHITIYEFFQKWILTTTLDDLKHFFNYNK